MWIGLALLILLIKTELIEITENGALVKKITTGIQTHLIEKEVEDFSVENKINKGENE